MSLTPNLTRVVTSSHYQQEKQLQLENCAINTEWFIYKLYIVFNTSRIRLLTKINCDCRLFNIQVYILLTAS